MEKMTKRDYFAMIIDAVKSGAWTPDADMVGFCENEIALLDRKADKAKAAAAVKKAAGDALTEAVFAVVPADEFVPIADIVLALADETVSTSKVTYRLNALVKDGLVEKTDMKIPATDVSKARTIKAFRKIAE